MSKLVPRSDHRKNAPKVLSSGVDIKNPATGVSISTNPSVVTSNTGRLPHTSSLKSMDEFLLLKRHAMSELVKSRFLEELKYRQLIANIDKITNNDFTKQTHLELLDAASSGTSPIDDPIQIFEDINLVETVALLGGEPVLGRAITNDQELLDALIQGFPAGVLSALREAGIPHSVFEQVVAPRRTLMRRKAEGQRLTRAESDAAWRLANVFALATRVLNGRKAAIDWLTRAKPTFANRTPIDLLETSVGAAHVSRMLQRLEWGDVA
jgi:putative toxin-antitoxin system antitoxin component (TIGR02293 family)